MPSLVPNLGVKVAKRADVQAQLDAESSAMLARARTNAAEYTKTGAYLDSLYEKTIRGRSGVLDREVGSTDRGAIAIEFGQHTTKRQVAGKFILTRAAFGGER